ncbi:MAG: substrate-binding domain-containing protein, partial [Acidimicrobiales bacterium]
MAAETKVPIPFTSCSSPVVWRVSVRPYRRSGYDKSQEEYTYDGTDAAPRLAARLTLALALVAAACGGADDAGGSSSGGSCLSGKIVVDGSSTVAPISEAITEEFRKEQPNVDVTVGTSGTGGGFKKFC